MKLLPIKNRPAHSMLKLECVRFNSMQRNWSKPVTAEAVSPFAIIMVEYISVAAGFGCGILVCWLMKQGRVGPALTGLPKAAGVSGGIRRAAGHGQQKLVLVVRMDLKMGKGKIAAQCSHATLAAYKRALDEAPDDLSSWKRSGQAKVVVKVDDERALYDIEEAAREAGLITAIISDAGMTQAAPGTVTVMGVGPAPASLLDQVTGHLKLL